MDFFKRIIGISDRSTEPFSKENKSSNVTVPVETPVPKVLAEKFPWLENAFRIQENDCASCKYIGSGISYGVCVYLLTTLRSPPKEAIQRKVPFYVAIASMTTTFFVLGTCRLFDVGFSAPQNEDEPKRFSDFMSEDIDAIKRFVNNCFGKEVFQPSWRSFLKEIDQIRGGGGGEGGGESDKNN